MGAVMTGECMDYLWVPLKRVSYPCLGCKCFQAHSMPFIFFCLIDFSFKRLVRGHFPSVVTSGDNVTHNNFMEMRILACDETPFLLAMPPRATTLAW
jgi:hypothetical protein